MARHLIHIGYPKTGSTFLQEWFASNPGIGYAKWGIGGFRDVFEVAAGGASPESVAWRVTSFEGFATPIGNFIFFDSRHPEKIAPTRRAQAEVCAILAELFPNASILLVTRGFRELILSVYSELVRGGLDCTFARFCAYLAQRVVEGENPFDYDGLIDRYRRAFGEANLIILPYELLSADPEAFVSELERRLGLETAAVASTRVNPSFTPQELHWYPRIARFARSLPIGEPLRRRLAGWHLAAARADRLHGLIRTLDRLRPAPPVTAELIPRSLIEKFRGRAEKLRPLPLYAELGQQYLFDAPAAAGPEA